MQVGRARLAGAARGLAPELGGAAQVRDNGLPVASHLLSLRLGALQVGARAIQGIWFRDTCHGDHGTPGPAGSVPPLRSSIRSSTSSSVASTESSLTDVDSW